MFSVVDAVVTPIKANPVLRREVQARWRTNQAFFVVFGYAVTLAVLAFWNYGAASRIGVRLDKNLHPLSFPGREMFIHFNQWQMAAWAIFAPLLTASAIAGEREGGQLDSLLLSHLTPEHIAWGKWGAAMAFIMLMLLVPLPIGALCFQLGGVSPFEFVLAALLQLGNAALCAAVGLYFSAKCQSTDQALGKSLASACWWGWLGPLLLVPAVFLDQIFGAFILMVLLPIYYTATCALVGFAAEEALRPLEEIGPRSNISWLDTAAKWSQEFAQSCEDGLRELRTPLPGEYYADSISGIPSPRAWPTARQTVAPAALPDIDDPERYKRWDMPGAERLRFENPVLQREVRRHLRLRAEQVGVKSGTTAEVLAHYFLFACFFLYGLALLGNAEKRPYFWGLFSTLWLLGAVVSAGVLGAGAFTRERAARMLVFLWLTRLTRGQVYWGKLAGALVVIAYYSLALAPVLLPCLLPRLSGAFMLQAGHVGGTLLLISSAAWAGATWGLLVSWLCRKTFVATAITLLGIWLFPYLPLLNWINPLAAATRLFPFDITTGTLKELPPWTPHDVFQVPAGLFGLGAFFALTTLLMMRINPRVRDDER